jgi:hypothetical protein
MINLLRHVGRNLVPKPGENSKIKNDLHKIKPRIIKNETVEGKSILLEFFQSCVGLQCLSKRSSSSISNLVDLKAVENINQK